MGCLLALSSLFVVMSRTLVVPIMEGVDTRGTLLISERRHNSQYPGALDAWHLDSTETTAHPTVGAPHPTRALITFYRGALDAILAREGTQARRPRRSGSCCASAARGSDHTDANTGVSLWWWLWRWQDCRELARARTDAGLRRGSALAPPRGASRAQCPIRCARSCPLRSGRSPS